LFPTPILKYAILVSPLFRRSSSATPHGGLLSPAALGPAKGVLNAIAGANLAGANPIANGSIPLGADLPSQLSPTPTVRTATRGQIVFSNWPPASSKQFPHVRALEATPGHVRHDLLIADSLGGKIIGHGGETYRQLKAQTGCHVFVLLKEGAPPGCSAEQRMVILIGTEAAVSLATAEISLLLNAKGGQARPSGVALARGSFSESPLGRFPESSRGSFSERPSAIPLAMGMPPPSMATMGAGVGAAVGAGMGAGGMGGNNGLEQWAGVMGGSHGGGMGAGGMGAGGMGAYAAAAPPLQTQVQMQQLHLQILQAQQQLQLLASQDMGYQAGGMLQQGGGILQQPVVTNTYSHAIPTVAEQQHAAMQAWGGMGHGC
jgi:hypothetical protein|tara:strand:- start:522 stop:1646 length:1125 start_codon:yes stop_codon:yes gene_type:complete